MTSTSLFHMLYIGLAGVLGSYLGTLIPTTPFLETIIAKNIDYHFVLRMIVCIIVFILAYLFDKWLSDRGIYL